MEWAASPDEVVLEHMNRAQNTIDVMLGDARTGRTRTVLTERDSAWVDVVDDLRWIDGGKRFTWISERDGWRHLYVVSRDGAKVRLVTPGTFDLHNPQSAFGASYVVGVDSAAGGSTTPRRRTTRRSSTSTARGSTARASQERVTPGTSRATTPTRSRATAGGRFTRYSGVRHAAGRRSRAPAEARAGADAGGQRAPSRRRRPAPARAGASS